jgi:GntR family transcriptional regulator / MocR family aminotransferase
MQLPLLLDRASVETLTAQLAGQLRQAIASTQLPSGLRLPSSRRLAEQLEVARNTVIRAYEALMVEGLIESRPSSGLFVAVTPPVEIHHPERFPAGSPARSLWSMPVPAVPSLPANCSLARRGRLSHDFAPGRPHPALFPLKAWRRLVLKQLARGGATGLTEGGDEAGLPSLRSAIAAHLAATRGVVADPARILITSGVRESVGLAARLFLHRGTTAAIEDPCAAGPALAFAATGSEVVGVGVDAEGLVPDRLPQRPTALLYLTPSHQFPTGHVLSAERRHAIAAWARRCGCYILEDDSDGELRFEGSPMKAIAANAPDCTIYLGAFSRTLGAGLQLGFMVVPARLAEAMTAAKRLFEGGGSWLEQAALAEMMQGSSYASHVTRVRAHYLENRDVLIAALKRNFGEGGISGEGGGLHLLWRLPPGVPDAGVVEAIAARRRIGVYSLPSGGAVSIVPSLLDRRALMIGFGAVTPKQIDQGVDLLSEIIDDSIDDPSTDVTEFLVRLPEAPTLVPRRRARAPAHLDSRFRRGPALPKSGPARASSMRLRSGAARLMSQVVSIYRYPVKGLSAEALRRAQLEADKPFPYDRVFALARPSAPIDLVNPQWAKKGMFAMLMLDEGLARVTTELDLSDLRLTVRRKGQVAISGRLDAEDDRRALEAFFWTLLPNFPGPPVLLRSRGGHFMDKPDNVISLINLATVRALEELWRTPIDPLRFRANLYIDGARPWEEFDWVGRDIQIGGVTFSVDRKNGRCGATNVNPVTGQRDLDIPGSLRGAFGHKNLGVYLIARENGAVAIGDAVAAPGETALPAEAIARARLAPARGRFICRGCYYIYDEVQGAPLHFAKPGTPFDSLPSDWRCPDCGTDKSTFRAHIESAA